MLRRVVIGACLVCPMGGGAYAIDNSEMECIEQLMRAEELVHNQIEAEALSEHEAENINELLDEADALCTGGNFDDARATLDTVTDRAAKAQP